MGAKNIKPKFNTIITEFECYDKDMAEADSPSICIAPSGTPKDYQKVIAVGDKNGFCNVGDYVKVHYKNFMKLQHKDNSLIEDTDIENKKIAFNPPVVVIDGKPHLILQNADIEFACEDYTEELVEVKESVIITPKQSIIDPTKGSTVGKEKKIIV